MLKYVRLPFRFDAGKMKEEVQALAGAQWDPHYNHRDYSGEWKAITLRSAGGGSQIYSLPASAHSQAYANTEISRLCPYILSIMESLPCEKSLVRLMNLKPGAHIRPHRDHELNFESGEARLHIPVQTSAEVDFFLQGERMDMKEGECWYLNFNLEHEVVNRSSSDRIHLVLDCVVNDWMRSLFLSPEAEKKEAEDNLAPKHTPEEATSIIGHLRDMNTSTSIAMAEEMERGMVNNK